MKQLTNKVTLYGFVYFVSKALDRLDHNILLKKMKDMEIHPVFQLDRKLPNR